MHVIGLSRQGKSYFLEHLIRQDIKNGVGLCVIDPHGSMYNNLVMWLIANKMHRRRRIHLINPAAGDWSVGFNPLAINDEHIGARVGAMIDACQKVWDDVESTGHKSLARLLEMVFTTLARHRLSLREAPLLASWHHREARQRLVEATGDIELIDDWLSVDDLRRSEFTLQFQGVHNRLRALTRAGGIAQMLGHTEGVLNFKTCMEEGHVVLVNLAHQGTVHPKVPQTVGALITADLYHAAHCRDTTIAEHAPFYCYIDECARYLNETVVDGLDETAKYGLHYILSHQGLDQLGKPDDPIRRGVMRGAQNKVVFLQDDVESAAEVGYFLFGKTFNLETPKKVLIKPTVVGFERQWLHSEGYSSGSSSADVTGNSSGTNSGVSMLDIDDPTATLFEGQTTGKSSATASGSSSSQSQSRSETLVPILEDLPTGVYSLDELKHLSAVQVRLLKQRQAFLYSADDRTPHQFATADVFPAKPTIRQADSFYRTIGDREPTAKPPAAVEAAVAQRRVAILGAPPQSGLETDDFFD